jgi:hypothetical protein
VNFLATLFVNPVELPGEMFWAVIPVSIVVAIVYKTIRTQSVRRLPREIVVLSLLIFAGEAALMAVGWAVVNWLR